METLPKEMLGLRIGREDLGLLPPNRANFIPGIQYRYEIRQLRRPFSYLTKWKRDTQEINLKSRYNVSATFEVVPRLQSMFRRKRGEDYLRDLTSSTDTYDLKHVIGPRRRNAHTAGITNQWINGLMYDICRAPPHRKQVG